MGPLGETFGSAAPLPRGPNRLTPEQIAESQRIRLMKSMVELLSETSWAEITIGSLVSRASVSRTAFYDNFENKLDCLLTAYEIFTSQIVEVAATTVDTEADFQTAAKQAIDAYLSAIQNNPISSRAFYVQMDAAGPQARELRREAIHKLAHVFEDRHRAIEGGNPDFEPFPFRIYLGFALGLRELIRDELEGNPDAVLTDMTDDIFMWGMSVFNRPSGLPLPPN